MGCCFSSQSGDHSTSRHRAYVVSPDGQLLQYSLPVTVSEVLQSQTSLFLCNSDRLYFDDYIPSLKLDEELEPAQIYFILPATKLQYRLTASDMAALAVKASIALDQIDRRRKRKTRISPVLSSDDDRQSNRTVNNRIAMNSSSGTTKSSGVSRSGSVRKLTRHSSRRVKLAVRSFRNKLTTIYEGSAI